MHTSAPRPSVSFKTHAARSPVVCRVTSSVAAAPMSRAAASLCAGAPVQRTREAPRISDSATAESPTGPEPRTSTVEPMGMSARSTAWSAVGSAQPPAMKRAASTPASGMQRVSGFK